MYGTTKVVSICLIGSVLILCSYISIYLASVSRNSFETTQDLHFDLPDINQTIQSCYHFDNSSEISCIPNIICPGVQKSGTTFLYFSLIIHPKIAQSNIKEVNYFIKNQYNKEYSHGVQEYSSYFVHNTDQILVDFSPKYMMVPEAAELIYQTNRNAKFIITLRDPVDRTYSQYRYQEYKKIKNDEKIEEILNSPCPRRIEDINFKHYLQEEYHILSKCHMLDFHHDKPYWLDSMQMPSNCTTWKMFDSRQIKKSCEFCFPNPDLVANPQVSVGYLSNSLYANHLKHMFKYFPKENFFFVRFEDLKEKGDVFVLNEICEWLGIDPLDEEEWGEMGYTNTNDYPDMLEDEEEFLRQFFREPNKELYELLGRDFGWKS